jgi:hypothetical protein
MRRRLFLQSGFLILGDRKLRVGQNPGFADFEKLMKLVSEGWSKQDTELALSAFTEDAVYMEPPEEQLFAGKAQLRPYFADLRKGTSMVWHQLSFNEEAQCGAGEYTFAHEGNETALHGVAVVQLRDGKISNWREYQRTGPKEFSDFIRRRDKQWTYSIKNYS